MKQVPGREKIRRDTSPTTETTLGHFSKSETYPLNLMIRTIGKEIFIHNSTPIMQFASYIFTEITPTLHHFNKNMNLVKANNGHIFSCTFLSHLGIPELIYTPVHTRM